MIAEQNWKQYALMLKYQLQDIRGDHVSTMEYLEKTLNIMLAKIDDDPYIRDVGDIESLLIQALALLGSVTYGDEETDAQYYSNPV
jgi:CRISPR/Cas system CSM-associated protein Csm2 small subunit